MSRDSDDIEPDGRIPTDRTDTTWVPFADQTRPPPIPRTPRVMWIRPRRWQRYQVGWGVVVLECPYCLSLVASLRTADEHLWRCHAGNTREWAGGMDLIPYVVELERRLYALERDTMYPGVNGTEQVWHGQPHEDIDGHRSDKHRRKTFREWCKYPSPPPERD